MRVTGIDIGLSGAMALVDSERWGEPEIVDLPTMAAEEKNDRGRQRVSGRGVFQQLLAWYEPGTRPIVFFENLQVSVRGGTGDGAHGNSMQSQGSLMRSRGIVEGACEVLRADIRPVYSQTWKRYYNLVGKPKDDARLLAQRMFPAVADLLQRKKDIDRAEALLIAHYGLVLLNGAPPVLLHVEPEEVPF